MLRITLRPVLIVFGFLGCFVAKNGFAQKQGPNITVNITVIKVGYSDEKNKKKKLRPVWKFYAYNEEGLEVPLKNQLNDYCFDFRRKKKEADFTIDKDEGQLDRFNAHLPSFKIKFETYTSTRGGETCTWDPKDQDHSIDTPSFPLNNVYPDEEFPTRINDSKGIFWADIKYRYSLKDLGTITSGNDLELKDASKDLVITTDNLPNKKTIPFVWQWSEEGEDWKDIAVSENDKDKLKFNPLKTIFKGNLNAVKKIFFRATANINNSPLVSETVELKFAPTPPTFGNKQFFNSCAGVPNGTLSLKEVRSTTGKFKYILLKAPATAPCDYMNPSATTCPGFIKTDKGVDGSNIEIRDLGPGKYVVFLYNDGEFGNIFTPYSFTIDEYEELKFREGSLSITQPGCDDQSGGTLSINVDGISNLQQAALIPSQPQAKFKIQGPLLTFKNLYEGTYTLELTDQCGKVISKFFKLNKPKKLSIETLTLMPKSNPPSFQVGVKNGSGGTYLIKIIDGLTGAVITTLDDKTELIVPVPPAGTYHLQVTDKNKSCPLVDKLITIEKKGKETKIN